MTDQKCEFLKKINSSFTVLQDKERLLLKKFYCYNGWSGTIFTIFRLPMNVLKLPNILSVARRERRIDSCLEKGLAVVFITSRTASHVYT